MPAISLFNNVMGSAIEIGRPSSGAKGLDPAVVLSGVDLGTTATVELFTKELDAAPAPAGANPAKSAAAKTTPPPIAPSVVRLFRLKVMLLFDCPVYSYANFMAV
jgi:hypothetical protein